MSVRKIPLNLPDEVLGYLSTMAVRKRTDVPTLIARAIEQVVTEDSERRGKRNPYKPLTQLEILARTMSAVRSQALKKGRAA